MLDRHGYGILMYDSRGRGESEGTPNGYGWDWEKDADGAMDWLAAHGDEQSRSSASPAAPTPRSTSPRPATTSTP